MERAIPLLFHGLQPPGSVDVNDGRNLRDGLRAKAQRPLHVGRFLVILEKCIPVLVQNGGREWPEVLPVLDSSVDAILDPGLSEIGQDGAVAQGARPELGPALDPPHDPSFGKHAGGNFMDGAGTMSKPWIAPIGLDPAAQPICGDFLPEIRRLEARLHAVIGVIPKEGKQGGAQCVPIVGWRREYVEATEPGLLKYLSIERRVEGAAARQHEIVRQSEGVQVAKQLGHALFEHELPRMREIGGIRARGLAPDRAGVLLWRVPQAQGSVFQGYANKQHDGFVGHSFVGEWVNLGANTNTSDLK